MDRADFISMVIALYPHAIKDQNAQFDIYKRALKKSLDVDYEALVDLFSQEYKESFPPAPGVLAEMASRCLIQESQETSKWLHIKVYNPLYNCITNRDCFPSGTTEEQMLNWYKKRFPNTEGWRIIEVYSLPEAG